MEPTTYQKAHAEQAVKEGLCIQCDDSVPLCSHCGRCSVCGHDYWCKYEDYR